MTHATLITESTAPPGLLTSWAEYDDELWEEFYERFGDDIADYNNALKSCPPHHPSPQAPN
jgi:uncharacterized protein YeaO (DUF488 family)